jgi:adenylate kinase
VTTTVAEHTNTASGLEMAPGPVLVLGAPGVGKGTQAKALMAAWRIPQISTGDILRAIKTDPIKAQTELGQTAKKLMDQGHLVSDELVNELVADRLQEKDVCNGYVLDGYPRTLVQAKWLDDYLAAQQTRCRLEGTVGDPASLPVVAVSIKVSYTELLRRVTGRRNCPVCQSIYNVYCNPPKVEGKCDLEGAELVQRADDTEAVFTERMRTYEAQTAPVVEHYRALGRFEEVDGEQSVEQVTAGIKAALARLRV